jgi:hypothetical protein
VHVRGVHGAGVKETDSCENKRRKQVFFIYFCGGAGKYAPMADPVPMTAGKVAALAVTIFPPFPTVAAALGSKKSNSNCNTQCQ